MTDKRVLLGHGSGGRLSQELVKQLMWPAFANEWLGEMHDGARLEIDGASLAFTTDSYVVKPLFFPGGDIGKLAVCGTVNDLAMTGAKPLYLSAGFVLSEGFALSDLARIVESMRQAAATAGVQIVTGDTKVVEHGALDGVIINTAGIGAILPGVRVSGALARPGQAILLSGTLGEHSLAVMAERHGLTIPADIISDCAPLNGMIEDLLRQLPEISVLRDPTRGGLATALNEIAAQSGVGIVLEEEAIPVQEAVAAVCDILGFDPLYLANEGKCLVFVEETKAEQAQAILRSHPYGREACRIGSVTAGAAGQVGLRTAVGGMRLLDMLSGDQLPRIC